MHVLDLTSLIFIVFVILTGFFRGALKEILAFLAWSLSFFCAWIGYDLLYKEFDFLQTIDVADHTKTFWVFLALFLVLLLVFSIIRFILSVFIPSVGIGIANRIIGMLAACAKGLTIIYICVMLYENFDPNFDPNFDQSSSGPNAKKSLVLKETNPYIIFLPKVTSSEK